MRELVYIHASTSYLASHFFNTQHSYLNLLDRDVNHDIIDQDVSFTQGVAADGSITFCPRLLLFDYKRQFGSLSNINALNSGQEDITADSTWTGPVVEHRQDPIPHSSYHQRLETEEDEYDDLKIQQSKEEIVPDFTPSIRFWSDFSTVFYHPRGLLRVPDPMEWEREIGWAQGAERFTIYDTEHSVLEDSFRLFTEECDLLQGIQLSLDVPLFGSFTVSLLSQLRDEYPKVPILTFCSLSQYDPAEVVLSDLPACIGTLNDALTLHELASLSTLTVPLQHPTTWNRGSWSKHLHADFKDRYHSSAILATHVESATLPLRLKQFVTSSTDLATLCGQLNWRGDTPFVALSGALPVLPSLDPEESCFDFSHPASLHKVKGLVSIAQRDIFRGLEANEKQIVQNWYEKKHLQLQEPLLSTSYFDAPYAIPSSYPHIFTRLGATGRGILSPGKTRVRSLPTYTSLRTTSRTGMLAGSYARLLDKILRHKPGVLNDLGAEKDHVGESVEGFWGLVRAYETEIDVADDVGERGEDEMDAM